MLVTGYDSSCSWILKKFIHFIDRLMARMRLMSFLQWELTRVSATSNLQDTGFLYGLPNLTKAAFILAKKIFLPPLLHNWVKTLSRYYPLGQWDL